MVARRICGMAAASVLLALCGCAPQSSFVEPPPQPLTTPSRPTSSTAPAISAVDLKALPDTIGLEHQDRVNRFNRLSKMYDVRPPQIDELQLNAGQLPGINYAVPVVRVIFDERVFFDFNKDVIRPDAKPVLDVIAQNMRRDVPDAQLLVLGHTDGVGTVPYNVDLSRRRATSVIQELIRRGASASQLSAVAIGKSQPIAPNETEEGRARNRRVEFMISANRVANLQLVERRKINEAYFKLTPSDPPTLSVPDHVEIIEPSSSPTLNAATGAQVTMQSAGAITLQKPAPVEIQLNRPEEYRPNKLNNEFVL